MNRFFKKTFVAGLDIGNTSIKLVLFKRKQADLVLEQVKCLELPRSEEPLEEKQLTALKEILKEISIKKTDFIVGVNCEQTGFRTISIPEKPENDLKEAVRLAAKNHFPFSLESSQLGFEILEEFKEDSLKKQLVSVVVSPKQTIESKQNLLKKIGITPTKIVPNAYAIAQCAAYNRMQKTTCLIDIGANFTELIILPAIQQNNSTQKTGPAICRKIQLAGADLTQALRVTLSSDKGEIQLSFEEAEKVKKEIGFPSEVGATLVAGKITLSQVFSMLRAPLEQLVNEIERCFDYYREETGGPPVESIILFGGTSLLKGLKPFLAKELGTEVRIGNPFTSMPNANYIKEEAPLFATAVGLSLARAHDIDLQIQKERKKILLTQLQLPAIFLVVLLSVGLSFFYTGLKQQLNTTKQRLAIINNELELLQPIFAQAIKKQTAIKILAQEPYWEEAFKELSNIIPKEIQLTEISMSNQIITLKGTILSEQKEKILSDLLLQLELGLFKNVKLISSNLTTQPNKSVFELRCKLN